MNFLFFSLYFYNLSSRSRTLSQGPDGKLSCMDEGEDPPVLNGVLQNGHCAAMATTGNSDSD